MIVAEAMQLRRMFCRSKTLPHCRRHSSVSVRSISATVSRAVATSPGDEYVCCVLGLRSLSAGGDVPGDLPMSTQRRHFQF